MKTQEWRRALLIEIELYEIYRRNILFQQIGSLMQSLRSFSRQRACMLELMRANKNNTHLPASIILSECAQCGRSRPCQAENDFDLWIIYFSICNLQPQCDEQRVTRIREDAARGDSFVAAKIIWHIICLAAAALCERRICARPYIHVGWKI